MKQTRGLLILGAMAVALAFGSCSSLPKMPKMSSLAWKFQQTADKKVQLGRHENSLSIKTEGVTVRFDVPQDWQVVSCVDKELNWHYVASSPDATLAFGAKVVRFPNDPPLEQRYANYLEGLQRHHDPAIQMVPGPIFDAGGKKVPSYQYYSPAWGQRLVIMVASGSVTTVFEFSASSPGFMSASPPVIQKILSTYSLRSN